MMRSGPPAHWRAASSRHSEPLTVLADQLARIGAACSGPMPLVKYHCVRAAERGGERAQFRARIRKQKDRCAPWRPAGRLPAVCRCRSTAGNAQQAPNLDRSQLVELIGSSPSCLSR